MLAVDDRNCLPLRRYAVRLLQVATAAGGGNPGPALNVLQQRAPRRLHLRWTDRALFIWLYRCCPRILSAITARRRRQTALPSRQSRATHAMTIEPAAR